MTTTQSNAPAGESARTVAAIDIGSNALRLEVAQVLPDGRMEVLERLGRMARLGQDTFRRGRLSGPTVRAVVAVLRDYCRMLEFYKVQDVRAVATSAVREAGNVDTFLDRVFMATGLDVEVINTSEESRLTFSAVRKEAGEALGGGRSNVLIANVGGGSTLLTMLKGGEIAASQGLPLGSIRLQESLGTAAESPERAAELLGHRIAAVVSTVHSAPPLKNIRRFVAVGGDARFAGREVGRPMPAGGLHAVSRRLLEDLIARCRRHTAEELVRLHGLPFADAETLNPALLIYQALLGATAAAEMVISQASMADGLLLDLARSVTGRADEGLDRGIIQSAETLALRFQADILHARLVSDLSARLFDELAADHGLGGRHRLLLRVAGLVHEVGSFLSSRAHHKHSFYLVANSEIFGLNRDELTIVAHVARYHRRSMPKPSHVEYMALPRRTRMVVNRLAALLRVADSLEPTDEAQVRHLRCERGDEELVIHQPAPADLALERRDVAAKGDLFEEIYGLKVRLEEAPR